MSNGGSASNLAAISLGSNINPLENLPRAVRALARLGPIMKVSRVWESSPVGYLNQANFLNAAVLWETSLPPEQIKNSVLKPIEQELLRVRDPQNKNAPRTIDLDLSLLITPQESLVFEKDLLIRAFVVIPLAELLPDFVHSETGQTLAKIAETFSAPSGNLISRTDCNLSVGGFAGDAK